MSGDFRGPERSGIRTRLNNKLKARVRLWVTGHQITYTDTPGHRVIAEYPSWATSRILQVDDNDGEPVRIGKYTGVHYTATFIPGGIHHFEWVASLHGHIENGEWVNPPDAIQSAGPIVLGNDVFVAFEAVIGSGITVGDGALVAARSMVVKDVEPYEMVGGNPAKHIRYRFDQPTREALLRIKWWDWSTDKVAQHKDQIYSSDVAGFVKGHDPELGNPSCTLCSAES